MRCVILFAGFVRFLIKFVEAQRLFNKYLICIDLEFGSIKSGSVLFLQGVAQSTWRLQGAAKVRLHNFYFLYVIK